MTDVVFESWGGNEPEKGIVFESWGDKGFSVGGLAKAAGSGLVRGVSGLIGLPGEVASLMDKGIDLGADALGLAPRNAPAPRPLAPTTSEVVGGVESVTGELYKPQNVAEEYASTLGEFAPGLLFGGPRKAISNMIAPALASETAGQATKGTEYEPYARLGGAIAGSVIPGMAQNALASRSVRKQIPTTDDLRAKSNAAYATAKSQNVIVKDQPFTDMVISLRDDLVNEGIDPQLHAGAFRSLQRLEELAGQPITFQSLETLRRVAGSAAKSKVPDEARLASRIIDKVDDFMEGLDHTKVVAGNAPAAVKALQEARKAWATSRKSEVVENVIERALDRVGANYSAAGFQTAIRQEIKSIMNNRNALRGFTQGERDAMRNIVRGAAPENILRYIGKLAVRGPISGGVSIGGGMALGGPAGAAAMAGVGEVAKRASTAITSRKVRDLGDLVRSGGSLPTPSGGASLDTRMLGLIESYLGSRKLRESLETPVP